MNKEFNQDTVNQIIDKGFDVNIGNVLSEGWKLCTKNIGSYIGYTILFFVLAMIGGVVAMIPIAGIFVWWAVILGLMLGYYVFTIKADQEGGQFSYFFQGFPFISQAVLYGIVLFLLQLPVVAITISISPFNPFEALLGGGDIFENIQRIALQQNEPSMLYYIVNFLGQIYQVFLSMIYVFVFFLIVDKKVNFWQAMEASRKVVMNKMLLFIALFLVLGLINLGGILFFVIGLFLTMPLSLCTIYVLYKSIFGSSLGSQFEDRISSFGEVESNSPFSR